MAGTKQPPPVRRKPRMKTRSTWKLARRTKSCCTMPLAKRPRRRHRTPSPRKMANRPKRAILQVRNRRFRRKKKVIFNRNDISPQSVFRTLSPTFKTKMLELG
uniref:(northern house mosquito) hypothetical protein n=1 Tax=Culex pipiens TaxID=7175 RepID=A0A8D8NPV9_CULPI